MSEEPEMEWLGGEVRDDREFLYALELRGCPKCGSRDVGDPSGRWYTRDGRNAGHSDLVCPDCGNKRRVAFWEKRDPAPVDYSRTDRVINRHLGGLSPSTVIAPLEFCAEIARCHSLFNPVFAGMPPNIFRQMRGLISSAMSAVIELRKFVPAGAERIPVDAFHTDDARAYCAANPLQFERVQLDRELERWIAHDNAGEAEMHRRGTLPADAPERAWPAAAPKPPMAQPLSELSFKLHKQWVEGKGGEPLDATGGDAGGKSFYGLDLRGIKLTDVGLDSTSLERTVFCDARLTNVRARSAKVMKADFSGSCLTDCDFTDSDLTGAAFVDTADITGCRFVDADLTRTNWQRANVKKSVFLRTNLTNAVLEGAFVDCNFREANLSCDHAISPTHGAQFVRCDLRDVNFAGRDLSRTIFTDCKFAAVKGKARIAALQVTRPDLSLAGDGSQIGTRRDVLLLLGFNQTAVPAAAPSSPAAQPTTHMVHYDLEMSDGVAVVRELARQQIRFAEKMEVRDNEVRLGLLIEERIGESRKLMIDAIVAHHSTVRAPSPEGRRAEALELAARWISRTISDSIDNGHTFEETVDTLTVYGLTREQALQSVIDPTAITRTLTFREGEPGKTE